MMIGVVAIIVEAIAVLVCCTAMRESDTPRKGPKIAPPNIAFRALLSRRPSMNILPRPVSRIMSAKPVAPVIILIWVAANGIYWAASVPAADSA